MSGLFAGQVAVITGGASGIGRALGAALSAAGALVLLADRTAGDDVVVCDVSRLEDLEALAERAWQRFGRVDLLFNNAGVGGGGGRLWKADLAEARKLFDINFWGVWHGCRAFAPRMIAQDHPSAIFNTASENALFCAVPRAGAYIASKHAVLGLTESLREDLPGHVHAGTIIPGWVASGLTAQNAEHAMPAERYAQIILPQIAARERFVVSHAVNVEPLRERTAAIEAAYAQHAPRYPGDEEYDVRAVMAKLRGG